MSLSGVDGSVCLCLAGHGVLPGAGTQLSWGCWRSATSWLVYPVIDKVCLVYRVTNLVCCSVYRIIDLVCRVFLIYHSKHIRL